MRRHGNLFLPETLEEAVRRPGLASSFLPQEIHQNGDTQVNQELVALAGASLRSRMILSTASSVEGSS
jgi:hypothetical protein